jgi:exodeoxyribonuclease VII large subunit
MHDTLKRRFPLVRVVLAPSRVQGSQAAAGIIGALKALNKIVKPDLIIVARGGGSIEDLMAFNDEGVAQAIADSQAPVITGIGHETDFTIADFVADLRAPTPTAAAELATPDQEELRTSMTDLRRDLSISMTNTLFEMGKRLEVNYDRLLFRTPLSRVQRDQQRLDDLIHRAAMASTHAIDLYRTRLAGLSLQLQSLDPRAILQRGYSIVTQPDGSLVSSVKQVQGGDNLRVQVSDGDFPVQVRESQEKGR